MDKQRQTLIGAACRRREDANLIAGRGVYVGDIPLTDPLHVTFVRSALPCARILSCDLAAARALPGVIAVFAGDAVSHLGRLPVNDVLTLSDHIDYPILANDRVGAVGQPIAGILATSPTIGQDAADLVFADLAPESCVAHQPIRGDWRHGDVEQAFAAADHVVRVRVDHPRLAPAPMEPRSIAIEYDEDGDRLTVWSSTQTPHRAQSVLAGITGIDPNAIRVISPDVGGAFGMKASLYPEEVFAVWAAYELKRSVRWIASRGDDFLAATHGRGGTNEGALAIDADGRIRGLRARMHAPLGHWLPNSALVPAWNAGRVLPTGYAVDHVDIETTATLSNTAPVGIYRGAGRPEANCLMERLIDEAAAVTGIDPLTLRQRNLIKDGAFPHRTATGNLLDSGQYGQALQQLADQADYQALRAEQAGRRANGELIGIGLAFYVEPCGRGWESATVTLNPDGTACVAAGGSSQGHGRSTAFAQIAAERLGMHLEDITVIHGDTATCPNGIGALASRSTAIGGSALALACDGALQARQHTADPEAPIINEVIYHVDDEAWGYGCYLTLMSIDRDTGVPAIERVWCVDDAGTIINPMLVEGQLHGGLAQGIGEALLERIIYDEDGQLLTGSFMDYAMPRAADMPSIDIQKRQTPSPFNLLGAKGVGEAATIGAPAAILNAAIDALRPLGVTDLTLPLTSEQLWRAIHQHDQEEQK